MEAWRLAPVLFPALLLGCTASPSSSPAESRTRWAGTPAGTEVLEFEVSVLGLAVGELTTTFAPGPPSTTIHLEGRSRPLFEPICRVQGVAIALWDHQLRPRRFVARWHEDDQRRERDVLFGDWSSLQWREGTRFSHAPQLIPTPHPTDPLSLLFWLRGQGRLASCETFEVLLGSRPESYRVTWTGEVDVPFDGREVPSHRYEVAIHSLTGEDSLQFEADARIVYEVLVSVDAHRLPLRIRQGLLSLSLERAHQPARFPLQPSELGQVQEVLEPRTF